MSGLAVSDVNGVKIYNLSSGKSVPQWLSEKKKRALAKDEEYRRRIELVQDFEFNSASHQIQMSPDGNYIVTGGSYPPAVKVFDVRELSLKFERRLDSEIVEMKILSEDFGKLAFLLADRSIALHAPYGAHYQLRIPKFGRAMDYHPISCDMYFGCSGSEIYRLNLDQGRYMTPLQIRGPGVNALKINPRHYLVTAGDESGCVECWDSRSKNAVARLDVNPYVKTLSRSTSDVEITSLEHDSDGLTMAVGTSGGHCLVYDLRASHPMITKTHQYGLPIKKISFHNSSGNILSADSKIIKIWDRTSEKLLANIETPADINSFHVVKESRGDTGLLFVAGEQSRMMTYYVPDLGLAPKWCSFLDNLTEELEEEKNTSVYDDYTFVTKDQLQQFGLEHLVGTSVLKAYMHGFFMDTRLYNRVKAVADPFAYQEWRKEKIKKKVAEKQGNRISIQNKLPKVNRAVAERLLTAKKKPKSGETILEDERFAQMFQSEDFKVDEESEEFKFRFPSGARKEERQDEAESEDEVIGDRFQRVEEESEPEGRGEDESSGESEYESYRKRAPAPKRRQNNDKDFRKKPKMFELADNETLTNAAELGKGADVEIQRRRRESKNIPLGKRMKYASSSK